MALGMQEAGAGDRHGGRRRVDSRRFVLDPMRPWSTAAVWGRFISRPLLADIGRQTNTCASAPGSARQVPPVAKFTGVDSQAHALLLAKDASSPPRLFAASVRVLQLAVPPCTMGTFLARCLPLLQRQMPAPTIAAVVGNQTLLVATVGVEGTLQRLLLRVILSERLARFFADTGRAFHDLNCRLGHESLRRNQEICSSSFSGGVQAVAESPAAAVDAWRSPAPPSTSRRAETVRVSAGMSWSSVRTLWVSWAMRLLTFRCRIGGAEGIFQHRHSPSRRQPSV